MSTEPRDPGGRLPTLVAAAGAALALSCGATCDRDPGGPPERYTDGRTDVAAGTYESAPVSGPFVAFPAGRTIEFVHGLGRTPDDFHVFLAFDRCPTETPCEPGDDVASGFTSGVGNQALVEDVDAEHIVVRNDTCSDVRIRVTASTAYRGRDAGAL